MTQPSYERNRRSLDRFFFAVLLAIAIAAILQAIVRWDFVNPDGVSYFSVASFMLRGEWSAALSGAWSPLYPLLIASIWLPIGGAAESAAVAARIVNVFSVFLLLISASLWWRWSRGQVDRSVAGALLFLVVLAWLVLETVGLKLVTPDILLTALLLLATATCIRAHHSGRRTHAALFGLALGAAYLTKTIAWYFAWGQLLVFAITMRRLNALLPAIALVCFLVIALPFATALSLQKGRLTVGDAGRIDMMWQIDGVPPVNFQGDAAHGIPLHPTRQIHERPAVYEYATPFDVTYPSSFDPTYWYDGVEAVARPRDVARVVWRNVRHMLVSTWPFFAAVAALLALGLRNRGESRTRPEDTLVVVLPALGCLALYQLTHIEMRYVVPFYLLLATAVADGTVLGGHRRNIAAAIAVILAAFAMIGTTMRHSVGDVLRVTMGRPVFETLHMRDTSLELRRMGFGEGDRVASLGRAYEPYWAFLLGARIVAEVEHDAVTPFWALSEREKACAYIALASTGARAIIAMETPPQQEEGWEALPAPFYVRMLSRPTDQELSSCNVAAPGQPVGHRAARFVR